MANYATLKAAIQDVIKTNGNNEITGALLQQSLVAMIDSMGVVGYQYVGVATPSTNPGTPDQNVFYLASTAGTYSNFGGLVLADGEIAILKYNGSWFKEPTGAASSEKVNQLGQELSYNYGVSNSIDVNAAIKEMYIVGLSLSDVMKIGMGKDANAVNIKLLNSDNELIADFTAGRNISPFRAMSGDATLFAIIDIENIPNGYAAYSATLNNHMVTNLASSPNLVDYFSDSEKTSQKPIYSKTTGKRISTDGLIVSAGASWFYTSPILLKAGDVAFLQSYGNVNAIPIAVTDALGTSYSAATVYGGSDPGVYLYVAKKDTYIAISGYDNNRFVLSIFSDTYMREILAGINERLSRVETDIANIKAEGGSLSLPAVNYAYRAPSVASGADVSDVANWRTENGATLMPGRKYNNITRLDRPVMTITSESGNGRAWCNLQTAVNANQKALLVEFRIDYEGNTIPGNVVIELWSGVSRTAAYKKSIMFQLSGDTGYYRNGWHQACFFLPSAQSFFVDGVSFDATNVTAVGFQLYNTNGVAYSVSVARMDFVNAMQKPGIVTIIDNFGVSVPAMADYAYSKGVRLNLSIIPGAYVAGTDAPVCASRAELDRVASQGHCIWNHTYEHKVLNTLSFAQIQDEINLAEQWMEQNGYGKNCDLLSIPSASFNTEASNAVFDSNVRMIFHNWCYNLQMVYVPVSPIIRTLPVTLLDSVATGEGKTGADIAAVAAKCITYNALSVIGFHGTYWEIDNGVSWKAYIDAIAELGVYHYGIDELIAGRWC